MTEAGGIVTQSDGRELFPLSAAAGTDPVDIVASGPAVHRQIVGEITAGREVAPA